MNAFGRLTDHKTVKFGSGAAPKFSRDEEDFKSINLNFDELYLTKEEFLVLNSEIKNIISKYKEKREKTDIYHMFSICAKGEIK